MVVAHGRRRGDRSRERLHLQHAGHRARLNARPAAATASRARRRPAPLSRFPDRVPDREAAGSSSRTTGSTSMIPRCRSAASRTSRTGARTWCPIRPSPALASSTSAPRATSCGACRRRADRARQARGRARSGWRAAADIEDGCVVPRPEGLPGLRLATIASISTSSGASSTAWRTSRPSAATACTATTTRTTPC